MHYQNNKHSYPWNAYPQLIVELMKWANTDKKISPVLIANTATAVISLTSQSLVDVIPPYSSQPEPCSIYTITIAESGEGKTTVGKELWRSSTDFSTQMTLEYQALLSQYKQKYETWKTINDGLKSSLKQAAKKGHDTTSISKMIKDHANKIPEKPSHMRFMYNDTTPKAIIEGLSEYEYAILFSDEGDTFFTGYLKNKMGFMNKAWDGEPYSYSRVDGEHYEIRPRLTLSLMAQPKVFNKYLNNNGELSKGSGFMSRVLFSDISSLPDCNYERPNNCTFQDTLDLFHGRIRELQERQREKFYNNDNSKISLELADDAKKYIKDKAVELNERTLTGQEWDHIKDAVTKAYANILRIAALFHSFTTDETKIISKTEVENACNIIEWHLEQMSKLFYPISERFQLEQDVYDLSTWIKNRFNNPKGESVVQNPMTGVFEKVKICEYQPFPRKDILIDGPYRLRNAERLNIVLEQMVSIGLIMIIKYGNNGALHISPPPISNGYTPPRISTPLGVPWIPVCTRETATYRHGNYSKALAQWNEI